MMESMQAEGVEWGEDYRHAVADALKTILSGRMEAAIDRHLAEMAARQQADRRNGSYTRHLLTELGDIELSVPRARFPTVCVSSVTEHHHGHL
jgi:transposase-like protein